MKIHLFNRNFHLPIVCLAIPLSILLYSCGTPGNIAYFQDAEHLNDMAVQAEQKFTLRPEDKINIIVNSSNPMLEQQFTLTSASRIGSLGASVTPQTTAGRGSSSGVSQSIAYTVDDQGTITFPLLGKISVVRKTRQQVAEYIQDRLIARELVDDPIVTVEYVNLGVNVLGEVAHPGHIDITKDHFTLTDAIASAGDLTINGERENVMVSRQVDGVLKVYSVDMTSMQKMLQSPAYYLQQNDLVYVSPNSKKMRDSRASGSTVSTPGFWMSLTSLFVTVANLVNNLLK